MLRRRKRGLRSLRKMILILLLAVIMITTGPFVWRMEQLRKAKNVYNVHKVQEELLWLEQNAGLFNNLEIIKDSKLWLELNMGSKDIESTLASYHDGKHQFWLFMFHLQNGKLLMGERVLETMNDSGLKLLAKGLMSIAKGDAQQSRLLLKETETNWESLSVQEQTIRHLALAQAAMIMGDHQSTQTELNAAQELDPNNPACLSIAFDVAMQDGQWKKALELSQLIDAQTWRPKSTLYETKKAILAIHEDNKLGLSDSLAALKELPQGDACIEYVNGIQALAKGQLEEGKSFLQRALKNGLDGELKGDAQKALNQAIDRLKADQSLRAVVAETN